MDDHLWPSPPPRGTHFLYFCFQIILGDNQPAILVYPMPGSLHRLFQPAISQIYLEMDSEEQAAEKNMLQNIYIICDRQARNVFIRQLLGAVSQ